ncbi:MAG: prolyl oligopeptidase family serine peptidase [Longimicrobiales bacterium]|nr:prolyl oligopeptidase family serine peptidase [Longimicrobiales bacterium]
MTRHPVRTSSRIPLTVLLLLAGALTASTPLAAQNVEAPTRDGRRVLTIDDYLLWRSVGDASISPDGRWVTYAFDHREIDDREPLVADRPLVIKRLPSVDSILVPRGSGPLFSDDSRWIAYFIDPPHNAGDDAGDGTDDSADEDDDEPRDVELRDLETGETRRWSDANPFGFADAGVLWLRKNPADEEAEYEGTDFIVRYLEAGHEELIPYVDEHALDESGARLAWTIDGPGGEANGVVLLDLTTRLRTTLDAEREATYARLTWGDEEEAPSRDALAVLRGTEVDALVERENALLLWPSVTSGSAPLVIDPRPVTDDSTKTNLLDAPARGALHGFPTERVLSEKGSLRWSHDARRLFVATRPQQLAPSEVCKTPTAADDEAGAEAGGEAPAGPGVSRLALRTGPDGRPLGPEEVLDGICPEFVADVNIWHVADDRIQSIQASRAEADRNRTHLGVVHVEAGSGLRYVQLADETMETVQISENGRTAVGSDDRAYRSDWRPDYRDWYRVDLDTGEREVILEAHERTLGFDPEGEHFLYWKDRHLWTFDVASGEHRNLSANAPVTYENEEFDRFGEKPPHGIAAWTTEGEPIVESRWDLWLQPLDGSAPRNLTKGVGAEREIEFRLLDLDPEEDEVDLDGPIWLTAFGTWTKEDGFFRLDDGDLEELVWDDARFGRPLKAKYADSVIFTRETFEVFPDWHVAGTDFADPTPITDANPQQAEYNWGRRILFDYHTPEGVRKQGTLAIPYDYREGERRPMLINYYEQYSQDLHRYPMPRNTGSPNFAGYVSDGYLVMQPDIHFRIGASHADMLASIELAIDAVEAMGYVDPDAIGLHGHSYSGQGSAYISTHSDRFAAIVAGAAATNLVSDFNALWGGGNNAHDYDIYGQGRLGVGLYDDLDLYIDQSAVHHAGSMNTPLLLLHGEDDQTVRFMHAVEFYNGLRWFEKNVVLLAYPGAGHGLRRYENQKDFQIRMRQFFDHHLRGAPAPRWMTEGRSFLEKERALEMVGDDKPGRGRR